MIYRVLIIENEGVVAQQLTALLTGQGYETKVASNAAAALRELAKAWSLIVFDPALPEISAEMVLEYANHKPIRPPVMVVSENGSLPLKLALFRHGCDDFVVRPFNEEEFLLRVMALLRRPQTMEPETFKYRDMELMVRSNELRIGGRTVTLTPKETGLCRLLMQRAESIVARKELLQSVWGLNRGTDSHFVEVHLSHLRKKVTEAGRKDWIRTIPKFGYVLGEPGSGTTCCYVGGTRGIHRNPACVP